MSAMTAVQETNAKVYERCGVLEEKIEVSRDENGKNIGAVLEAIKAMNLQRTTENIRGSDKGLYEHPPREVRNIVEKEKGDDGSTSGPRNWAMKLSSEEVDRMVRMAEPPTGKRYKFLYLGGVPDKMFINKKLCCRWLGVNVSDIVFVRKCKGNVRELFINSSIAKKLSEKCIENFEGVSLSSDPSVLQAICLGEAEVSFEVAMNIVLKNWSKMVSVCRGANRVLASLLNVPGANPLKSFFLSDYQSLGVALEEQDSKVKRKKEEVVPPESQ
ncbi:hypothetical protein NGRA_3221 [Nosema granulosis]|uniref:Uncharacterized protein n=1 Tax=Nosema granulosis TaxID=83296 RepID=A0A9P6KWZ0_9MICR|nr:hypothetical protein NGRA_3221 [Nosema granulosis]